MGSSTHDSVTRQQLLDMRTRAPARWGGEVHAWEQFRQVIPLVSLKSLIGDAANRPRVAILMATMQGQRFLAEQLNSIATQSHPLWVVYASDDGSDDFTHDILQYYQSHWGEQRVVIHEGPAEGSTANFLSLTCRADIDADYFAYADQDDIWESDKLERAVRWLQTVPPEVPALYGSRTQLVDARNQHLGYSLLFEREPSFRNALVQNIAGGNTMVFNRAARRLLREAGENVRAVTHDWWAYMVVTGCGGRVHYDPTPTLRYRQHENNLVGSNQGWAARMTRLRLLLQGRFRRWNEANIDSLQAIRHLLTEENRALLDAFVALREASPLARVALLQHSGLYRQTVMGNGALFAAALIKRL